MQLVCTGDEQRLTAEREIMIYRIIREFLTNALKHAKASQIVVQLIFYDAMLYASVEDNGQGMSKDALTGIGLETIRLRVAHLNARMNTESGPTVTLVTPDVPYLN